MYPEQERRAPFGPEVSWPTGYSDLEYRDGDYRYGGQHAAQPPAAAQDVVGEHPYAAFAAAGYGDDGYRDPGYQGPAAQDTGIPGTRTVRGFVEPGQYAGHGQPGGYLRDGYPGPGHPSGAYPVQSYTGYREIEMAYPPSVADPSSPSPEAYHGADSYKQPWDYDQPLRYDDEEVYPAPEDDYGQADGYGSDYDTGTYQPRGYERDAYNGSDYSMPGVNGPGYDLSGIIGTSDFQAVDYDRRGEYEQPGDYDQPGYDRLSYDDPRYADAPDYRDAGRYAETSYHEPRFSETRFDVARFDETRLDNLWLAADDVREEAAPVGYDDDGFSGTSVRSEYSEVRPGQSRMFSETRTDMRALSALEADRTRFDMPVFDETRIDNLRATSTGMDMRPAAAALLAPPAAHPRSWAEDTSLDHFADLDLTDEPVPAAFTRASLSTLDDRPEVDDTATRRAVGRRRGRSSDRRQWMALGAIAVVAAGAIGGVLMKYVFPRSTGPAHDVVAAQAVGAYRQSATLEKEMNVSSLARSVGASSSGQASGVVSAVYQLGSVAPGSNPQIFMFVGGKLASADPSASIANFEQSYPNAHAVSAGSLGGQAACTESKVNGEEAAMCVWFDNDTFGALVSSTMTTAKLATTLDQVRPSLELYAK